jgi:hypothetical protein
LLHTAVLDTVQLVATHSCTSVAATTESQPSGSVFRVGFVVN